MLGQNVTPLKHMDNIFLKTRASPLNQGLTFGMPAKKNRRAIKALAAMNSIIIDNEVNSLPAVRQWATLPPGASPTARSATSPPTRAPATRTRSWATHPRCAAPSTSTASLTSRLLSSSTLPSLPSTPPATLAASISAPPRSSSTPSSAPGPSLRP